MYVWVCTVGSQITLYSTLSKIFSPGDHYPSLLSSVNPARGDNVIPYCVFVCYVYVIYVRSFSTQVYATVVLIAAASINRVEG